jgi:hypothetical protein
MKFYDWLLVLVGAFLMLSGAITIFSGVDPGPLQGLPWTPTIVGVVLFLIGLFRHLFFGKRDIDERP